MNEPVVRRFAAVIAPPGVAPDDLVHDALVAALRQGTLSELDDPAAYLRRAMLNLSSNHKRRFSPGRRAAARLGGSSDARADEYPSDLARACPRELARGPRHGVPR